MNIALKYVKKLLPAVFAVAAVFLLSGHALADDNNMSNNVPHGIYSTTIVFQDNGEVETGTLQFKPDGTLIETNTAVAGDHLGTWTSTGTNSFSLQFSETLPNGFVVVVQQANDTFTNGTIAFTGTSVGTVYNGDTVVGQRTTTVTAEKSDE